MNQNTFVTAIEVHNMLKNIVKLNKYYNSSLIGRIKGNNNCALYKIKGGCYCY